MKQNFSRSLQRMREALVWIMVCGVACVPVLMLAGLNKPSATMLLGPILIVSGIAGIAAVIVTIVRWVRGLP